MSSNNDYIAGRAEWNERYGSHLAQAKNWRLACFAALGLLGLSVGGNVIQGTQSKVVPYVVTIDTLGQSVAGAISTKADASAEERMRKYMIAEFVKDFRSVVSDSDLLSAQLTRALTRSGPAARNYIAEIYGLKADDPTADPRSPFALAKDSTIAINIASMLPVDGSKSTWTIDWTEDRRSSKDGSITSRKAYRGSFIIEWTPPVDTEAARLNPLGMVVTAIDLNEIKN